MDMLPAESEVLVVGDGDLSYSAALANVLGKREDVHLIATTLDSLGSLTKRYVRAENNVKILSSIPNVSLYYGVDARELQKYTFAKDRKFYRIVFNFPHPGGKNCMATNRKLLSDFFMSAETVLCDGGEIWLTLCDGQGGTPADNRQREWHNSWQVVGMAAKANLILTRVVAFDSETYIRYRSTGHRGFDRGFATDGALTHVFVRAPEAVDDHVTWWQSSLLHVWNVELESRWDIDDVLWAYTDSAFLKTIKIIPCDLVDILPEHNPVSMVYLRLRDHLMSIQTSESTIDFSDIKDCVCSVMVKPCVVYRQCMIGKEVEHQPVVFNVHGTFYGKLSGPDQTEAVKQILFDSIKILGTFDHINWICDTSHTVWKLTEQEESHKHELCAVNCYCQAPADGWCLIQFTVFLSNLVVKLFQIRDARLLFSSDTRLFKQLESLSDCAVWEFVVFRPVSIYPCSYQHDVGFWTKQGINELRLSEVIRSVTGDIIKSVSLINAFRKDDKTGLCYRIVYQSNDKAVSEAKAGQLQLSVREALAREFGVELR